MQIPKAIKQNFKAIRQFYKAIKQINQSKLLKPSRFAAGGKVLRVEAACG